MIFFNFFIKGENLLLYPTINNKLFDVRPKGTLEERKEMLLNGESYLNKNLTVKFFELTDRGVPRFPVGISLRDYE